MFNCLGIIVIADYGHNQSSSIKERDEWLFQQVSIATFTGNNLQAGLFYIVDKQVFSE